MLALSNQAFAADDGEPDAAEPSVAVKTAKTKAAKKSAGKDRADVLGILTSANPMLWPLGLCSIVALGFALERMFALRINRVTPKEFVDRFVDRLGGGKLDFERALELCKANESPAARVFAQTLRYWGQPAAAIRQAVGHDAAAEIIDLKRNVRVLNATASLAPLLGLLGTVIGIIEAFEALGTKTGPARAAALAHGISLALVTTGLGLAIAIVSVVFYYYLLNRVDVAARRLDESARRVIDLVSGDAPRPQGHDRRPAPAPHHELSRHEGRIS